MRGIILKSISFIILGILLLSFITFISLIAFVRRDPQRVITFLQQMQPTPTPVPMNIKGMAVLGDSQSDEYRADDDRGDNYESTTLNWVELLQKYRKINFGEWGVWGEPRRTGYAYDWARTGATTNSMIESGQHVGVAEQVKNGEVNVVVIFIGSNDFAPRITEDGYQEIYDGTLSDALLYRKINRMVADVATAIDTIQKAGNPKILLVKIADWGVHPGVQIAFPIPANRSRVSDAIAMTNDELERIATERGVATIDPNAFYDSLPRNSSAKIQIGNVTMEELLLTNDSRNIFLADGVHLGTVMNGLFANYIMRALNQDFGTSIKPFSNTEIFNAAGIVQ